MLKRLMVFLTFATLLPLGLTGFNSWAQEDQPDPYQPNYVQNGYTAEQNQAPGQGQEATGQHTQRQRNLLRRHGPKSAKNFEKHNVKQRSLKTAATKTKALKTTHVARRNSPRGNSQRVQLGQKHQQLAQNQTRGQSQTHRQNQTIQKSQTLAQKHQNPTHGRQNLVRANTFRRQKGAIASSTILPKNNRSQFQYAAATISASPSTYNLSAANNSAEANNSQTFALPEPPNSMSTLSTKVKKKEDSDADFNHWEFKYRTMNQLGLGEVENIAGGPDAGEVVAWDRINVTYNFTKDVNVSLMPEFTHTWFGNPGREQDSSMPDLSQPGSFYWGDLGLFLTDKSLFKLKGGLNVEGFTAFYFPTSETSQLAGQIGTWRSSVSIGRSFGIFDIKWKEDLWWFIQGYTTSSIYQVNEQGMLDPVQNNSYWLYSVADIAVNFTKKFSLNLETGLKNAQVYADQADNLPATQSNAIEMNPEFDYQLTKNLNLALGLYEEAAINNTPQPYTPFSAFNAGDIVYLEVDVKI